jgi:hypothetical protein
MRTSPEQFNKFQRDLMIERERTNSVLTAFGNASNEDAVEKIYREHEHLVNQHSHLLKAKYSALKRIRRIKWTAFHMEPIQYLN